MSRRDWLHHVAVRGFLIVILLCAMSALAQEEKPEHRHEGAQTTETKQQSATQSTADRIILEREQPIETDWGKPNCDKPQNHDEADLCQQRRMSEATEEAARLSAWQIGIGVVTLISLWATVYYAGKAAYAAINAAGLTEQANELLIRNSALELRAYLSVEPAGIINLINREDGIGVVAVKNVGKLPARNVFVYCDMQIREDRAASLPVVLDTESVSRVIQPGASLRQGSASVFPSAQIRADGKEIFVWGVVYYDIGDRVRRFTKFCLRYTSDAHDRTTALNKRPRESIIIIDASHARYHIDGNDAN